MWAQQSGDQKFFFICCSVWFLDDPEGARFLNALDSLSVLLARKIQLVSGFEKVHPENLPTCRNMGEAAMRCLQSYFA